MKYKQLYEDVKNLVEKNDYRKGIAYLPWNSFTVYYNTARHRILKEICSISTYLYEEEIYDNLTGENYYELQKEGIIHKVFWHPSPFYEEPYELEYSGSPLKGNFYKGLPKKFYVEKFSGLPKIVVFPSPSQTGKILVIWTPIFNQITTFDFEKDIEFPEFLYDFVKFCIANYILELEKKVNEQLKLFYLEEKQKLSELPRIPRVSRIINKIDFRF